jgi:hypothetical protein
MASSFVRAPQRLDRVPRGGLNRLLTFRHRGQPAGVEGFAQEVDLPVRDRRGTTHLCPRNGRLVVSEEREIIRHMTILRSGQRDLVTSARGVAHTDGDSAKDDTQG